MDFTSFTQTVAEQLTKKTEGRYHIHLHQVQKNNGIVLTGVTLKEDNSNISPTIYLESYHQEYENGTPMEEIVDSILMANEKNKADRNFNADFFTDYEQVKNKIIFKVISYEKNKQLLSDIPYVRYLDLAIVFQCLISSEDYGNATILIHNQHLHMWNVTCDNLYDVAMKNTPVLLPYKLQSMKEALSGMNLICDEDIVLPESPIPMYVLSNKCSTSGASVMLYPNILSDFAKTLNGDFFILPSSIHECLLLPAEGNDADALRQMVREVNDTQVAEEEILSYSVYRFFRESGKLEIA